MERLLLSLMGLGYFGSELMPESVYLCNSSRVLAVGVNKAVGC